MTKSSTCHNGQLTIDFETLKEMFQIENPDLHLGVDLSPDDEQMLLYHMILSNIASPLGPHLNAETTRVKSFRAYAGESEAMQSCAFLDFEVPAAGDQKTERYFAMILYHLGPHATIPDKLGITVSFAMHGKLETVADNCIDFTPLELRCRQVIDKMNTLASVDPTLPHNVKGAICYADTIFRCFLEGTSINYVEIQECLSTEAFDEVATRYEELLQRTNDGLILETTSEEEFNIRNLGAVIVHAAPKYRQ